PTPPKQPPMSVQNTPPNAPMPSSKPKTYLQTLVDGDGALATIASYKAEEKTTIKANTDALIGLVETSTNNTTEAVSSLVAGTNQFFNQVSSNASISQNLKDTFIGFYHLASNTSHDLVGLQSSLSQLISQVEQLQQALLTSLLNTSIMRTQTEGGLFAVNHRNQLDPQSRQGKGKAIQDLGTLLAYLQATQSKLKAYAKDHPSLLAATPSSIVATQSGHVNGDLYGVNAQLGYKQFFGKKKRFGLRYYGSFSYQYGTLTDKYATALSNLVYGAGVDALYNFYESANGHYTTGFFAGFMLAGSTWLLKNAKAYKALAHALKRRGGQASIHATYFQIPLNIGFRSLSSYFEATSGDESFNISYKRNVSVFVNYVYNF
ncbi:outer membrane protein, partial [Helicobacter ailurogastricus]